MKNKFLNVVVTLIFAAAAVGSQSRASQGLIDQSVNLSPGDSVSVNCQGSTLSRTSVSSSVWKIVCRVVATLTPTRTPTHAATQPPATVTQPPATTAAPSVTAPPPSTATLVTPPTAGGHDANRWHALGFGHEHGDDPNSPAIVAIFGPAGDLWNGSTTANIGVPFETSAIENTMKHPMAKYYTMTPAQKEAAGYPCGREDGDHNETDNGGRPSNCVRAWRILAHGGGNLTEAMTNNHSVWVEMQVCSRASNFVECGIIRTGGWVFYGKLQSPFYNQAFERAGGIKTIGGMTMTFKSDAEDLAAIQSPNTVFEDWGGEPYWFVERNGPNGVDFYNRYDFTVAGDQISSNEVGPSDSFDCAPFPRGPLCGNRLFHIAIRFWDGWNLVDGNNIYNPVFICSQISPSNCRFNGTFRGMKEVQVWINPVWDGAAFDTDSRVGFVSFSRYTDRYQRLRPIGACSTISVDCVPLVLDRTPISYASVKTKMGEVEAGVDRDHQTPGSIISFPN